MLPPVHRLLSSRVVYQFTEFGHMLISIATEYNDALLVIGNGGIGCLPIQTVIDRGYANLFYMTEDLVSLIPTNYVVTSCIVRTKRLFSDLPPQVVHDHSSFLSWINTCEKRRSLSVSGMIDKLMTFAWENGVTRK